MNAAALHELGRLEDAEDAPNYRELYLGMVKQNSHLKTALAAALYALEAADKALRDNGHYKDSAKSLAGLQALAAALKGGK